MRFTAVVICLALVLTSCSSQSTPPVSPLLPTLQLTGQPQQLVAFDTSTPSAYNAGTPIVPLFEIRQIPTNQGTLGLTFWGEKDASGNITSVAQAQVTSIGSSTSSVHIFFDTSNHPIYFRDDATGYGIAVTNISATQQTITLCMPDGSADSNATLTETNGTVQTSDVSSGGSCQLANAQAAPARHFGSVHTASATNVSNLTQLAALIQSASYVAGLGFTIAALLKFKSHKTNPTTVPIGTPIALVFIAAALIFLPTILSVAGSTMFGSDPVADASGTLPVYLGESFTGVFPSPDPTP